LIDCESTAWEKYIAPIPVEERGDFIRAYHKRLTGDNEEEKLKCALAWTGWEMTTSEYIHLLFSLIRSF
jgi:proline iminopeptidase